MEQTRFDGHETGPGDANAAVIWLHGLGADCYDFAPIVPELGLSRGLSVRFVFPNAPIRPITLNGGMRMRGWYDITSLEFDERRQDDRGIAASVGTVRGLVDREVARGVDPRRIALCGFSQGGAIAVQAALTHAAPLAGVVALSTYLLYPASAASGAGGAGHGLPFFVAHGTADPIVPFRAGEFLRDRIAAAGYPVEWHTYPVPHAVHPDEIAHVGQFLGARLAG
jgi:phospholipase/carboxylesterase